MRLHRAIAEHQEAIAAICRRYGVRRLEVFGSAACGGDFDETRSDADFLVQFTGDGKFGPLEEFFGLREALSQVLMRPVDLTEPGAIRNPYVKRAIDQTRELVYAA